VSRGDLNAKDAQVFAKERKGVVLSVPLRLGFATFALRPPSKNPSARNQPMQQIEQSDSGKHHD
jgi:hypothetical protein